jgi:hypothetical protein
MIGNIVAAIDLGRHPEPLESPVNDDRFPIPLAPMIAVAIAVIGSTTLLLVDHGPWSRPDILAATNLLTASSAAEQKAGVTVAPTVVSPFGPPVASAQRAQ